MSISAFGPDPWVVVDVNDILAYGFRRMSIGLGISPLKAEK
jgi:hypothetical protein